MMSRFWAARHVHDTEVTEQLAKLARARIEAENRIAPVRAALWDGERGSLLRA